MMLGPFDYLIVAGISLLAMVVVAAATFALGYAFLVSVYELRTGRKHFGKD